MVQPRYLLIGEILRPHGIAGELKMRVLTGYPERLHAHQTLYLADSPEAESPEAYKLRSVRFHQGYALIRLEAVPDRTAAERYRQLYVMVAMEDAVPLEPDEHYLFELIGLQVLTEQGESLGEIVDVMETGANDVYVVRGGPYGEVLIPATEHTILSTDVTARHIVVRLPDGLLPTT